LKPNTNYSVQARALEAGGLNFTSSQSPFGPAVTVSTSKFYAPIATYTKHVLVFCCNAQKFDFVDAENVDRITLLRSFRGLAP